MNATTTTTPTRSLWPGIFLIGLGVMLLLGQWFTFSGGVVLGVIALFFFGMYAATRGYGFLIPGFILAGLAGGVALEEGNVETNGGAVVLGLALGFLAIYVANVVLARPAHWWPLVPGTILGTVGGSLIIGGTEAGTLLAQLWPIALIALGVVLIALRTLTPAPKG